MKLLLLMIFVTTLMLSSGRMECDIIKNQQLKDLDISNDTINATKRNNTDVYQVKAKESVSKCVLSNITITVSGQALCIAKICNLRAWQ